MDTFVSSCVSSLFLSVPRSLPLAFQGKAVHRLPPSLCNSHSLQPLQKKTHGCESLSHPHISSLHRGHRDPKKKKKKDGKVMYLIFVLFIAKLIFRQPVVWCYVRTGPRPRLGKTESRSKREAPGPRRSRARPTGGELALSLVCFQADVLCEAARDPALRLSEQCPHDHAALQPGQGAGEILQDVV